jgi:hypothetical protein
MRPVYRALLVLVAMIMVSGIAAGSAFATPEWYAKTGGVFKKLTSTLNVKAITKFSVIDSQFLVGEGGLSCEGHAEGTVEVGGVGKINSFTVTSCKAIGSCSAPATVRSVNLSWKTELYSEVGTVRERLVSGGSGTPGWEFECETLLGHVKDLCNLNTSGHMINSGVSVEAEFEEKSNKTTCGRGGLESGRLAGIVKFSPPEGVEAIKVE